MNNGLTSRAVIMPWLASTLLLLSACATTNPKADSIEARAMARWEAVLSGDFTAAYEYLSPGFRSSVSAAQYERSILQKRIKWVGATYIESECTETSCKVKISIDYKAFNALPGVKVYTGAGDIEESWLRHNGTWYLVPGR